MQIPPEPSRLCCFSFIARNRGHFASVINCQRHLFFKMADKNNRSQGKRFPYDILNNLGSLDLFIRSLYPVKQKTWLLGEVWSCEAFPFPCPTEMVIRK